MQWKFYELHRIYYMSCCLYNLWTEQFLRIARSLHSEVRIKINNIFILIPALSFLTPPNSTTVNCSVHLLGYNSLFTVNSLFWFLMNTTLDRMFCLLFSLREFRVQEGKVVIPLGVTVHGDVVVSVYHMRSTIGGRLQAKVWLDVSFKCKVKH